MRIIVISLVCAFLLIGLVVRTLAATLEPGHILATVNSGFGDSLIGKVVLVNLEDGSVTTLASVPGERLGDIEQHPTAGLIYVAADFSDTLYVFNPETGVVDVLAEGEELGQITGLAVAETGNVFVGDRATGSLVRIEATGSQELLAGGFFNPEDVAIRSDGSVLVANETLVGNPCAFIEVNPVTGASQVISTGFFDDIDAFALGTDNSVAIVGSDSDEGVVRFDLDSEVKTPISSGFFSDVTRRQEGNLVATGFGAGITGIDATTGSQETIIATDAEGISVVRLRVVPEANALLQSVVAAASLYALAAAQRIGHFAVPR